MDLAWVSLVVGTVLNVAALYFTWRSDRRAERNWRGPATVQAGNPTAQPPRQAPAYPPSAVSRRRAPDQGAPPETGGGAWFAAWAGVILAVTTAVYMIPDYMVRSFGSVQEYEDTYQAVVVMTALTAFGLAVSAWIRGRTDLRLQRRITRKIVYVHTLVALAGLIICTTATIKNPRYML